MKKILITSIMAIFSVIAASAQFNRHALFMGDFTTIDTLTLEQAPTPFPTSDNNYLITLPRESKMVIAYNSDKTKAKVLLTGQIMHRRWNRHMMNVFMEYDVEDNQARLILYHKDNRIFCGYIYDKKAKACQRFEAINEEEKDKLIEKMPFIPFHLKFMPTFKNESD